MKGMPAEIGKHIVPYWRFVHDSIRDYCFKKYIKEIPKYNNVEQYKNIHKDERCFILGSGPSIKETNLNLIKDEIFIGVNTIIDITKHFDITFKYYAIVDSFDLPVYFKKLQNNNVTLFLSGNASPKYLWKKEELDQYLQEDPVLTEYRGSLLQHKNNAIGNIKYGVYSGCTVIGFAIQLAYWMGFKEVYLLGCDCDYSNQKYFDGTELNRFFGAGNEDLGWNKIFKSYKILKEVFEKEERKIYNSTIGGKLEVFERKKLEDIV